MIAFVLAMGMVIVTIIIAGIFLVWVLREHQIANKYRYLLRLRSQLSPEELRGAYNKGSAAPRWRVTYRVKGKQATEEIEAATEAIALREFTRSHAIGYGSIVKCEKC